MLPKLREPDATMKDRKMKIEHADGWVKIKRIGGVTFVPATALELQGCEDAEELAEEGYGFIEFSGLDGEAMGRTRDLYDSIAGWIEDVMEGQLKKSARKKGAFLCALLRWELLPDLQVALQRTKFPWAFKEAGASVTPSVTP